MAIRDECCRGADGSGLASPDAAIGLAKVRLDRFISLEPWQKNEMCWIITKPFQLQGKSLELNGDFSEGRLVLEILDTEGKSIDGFTAADMEPIEQADDVKLAVCWKGGKDLSHIKGQDVRLKMSWERGKLFAFQIRE